jgi:pPIWI RE three-gene island domain Z
MFETQAWCESLLQRIGQEDQSNELPENVPDLLVRVELMGCLIERLNYTEPLLTGWILLTGHPFPEVFLQGLSDEQRKMLANARVLLHYGKFGWKIALETYAALPAEWRYYLFDPNNPLQRLQREPNGPTRVTGRMRIYEQALLMSIFPYRLRRNVVANTAKVFFEVKRGGARILSAELDAAAMRFVRNQPIPLPFGSWPKAKQQPVIDYAQLLTTARWLDQQEQALAFSSRTNWEAFTQNALQYRLFQNGTLGPANIGTITFTGHLHMPGMVSAGKSMLAKMVAIAGARSGAWRTTLVVSDVISAILLADYFNRIFQTVDRQPIAVPLLGRTTQAQHIEKLTQADLLRPGASINRWFDTRCPLQGMIGNNELREAPLSPGGEPCERLYEKESDVRQADKRVICPFFRVCPSHQLSRDIPQARIWIVTPGAMASSRLPVMIEERFVQLGEVIYQETDLVIFDEVETIQQWFDRAFATSQTLIQRTGGALKTLATLAQDYLSNSNALSNQDRRWVFSAIRAYEIGLYLCDMVRNSSLIQQWIAEIYFTPHRLFSDLSLRLLGINPNTPNLTMTAQQEQEREQLLAIFHEFHDDYMMPPFKTPTLLHDIANALLARNGSGVDPRIREQCLSWMQNAVPSFTSRLSQFQNGGQQGRQPSSRRSTRYTRSVRTAPAETLQSLTERLEFVLVTSILDRLVSYVLESWYNVPAPLLRIIRDEDLFQRISTDLQGILPLAPMGMLGGFLCTDDDRRPDNPNPGVPLPRRTMRLQAFRYQNVGRWYVLHFHDLLKQIGYPGPGVLSLSGTSWLPDAAGWHVDVPPAGILMAHQRSVQAIRRSEFFFLPQAGEEGERLNVSGSGRLTTRIREVARQLAGFPTPALSPLQSEFQELERLAQEEQARNRRQRVASRRTNLWIDRQRILLFVNSYDQVRATIEGILSRQPEREASIYGLVQRREENADEQDRWMPARSILGRQVQRADIEAFGRQTNGSILVAPLQAIGRGYNILNAYGVAAFGSVFFLTRPMPVPFDLERRAEWLNSQFLKWCATPSHPLWQSGTFSTKSDALHKQALLYWESYEGQIGELTYGFPPLVYEERLKDLLASLAGLLIQPCGRLLRGSMPFRATFVDAAWMNQIVDPINGQRSSYIPAMVNLLQSYCRRDPCARALFGAFIQSLQRSLANWSANS